MPNTPCSGGDVSSCLQACATLQVGTDCVSSCPALTYDAAVNSSSWSAAYPETPLLAVNGCLPCDPFCASACSSSGPSACLPGSNGLCNSLQFGSVCVVECPNMTYASSNGTCLPCHSQCLGCLDEGPDACLQCVGPRVGSTCVESCPDHTYLSRFDSAVP